MSAYNAKNRKSQSRGPGTDIEVWHSSDLKGICENHQTLARAVRQEVREPILGFLGIVRL